MSRGPVATLIAVVALGAVLLGLNLASADPTPQDAGDVSAGVSAPTSAPASPSSSPPVSAGVQSAAPGAATYSAAAATPLPPRARYVGEADTARGPVPVAVTVDGDRAKVYVCDGSRVEAWLQGSARDGYLDATGRRGNHLAGRLDGDRLTGTVALAGYPQWTFTAAPSTGRRAGIYRASSGGRTSGWIVQDDSGRQVGLSHDPAGALTPAWPLPLDALPAGVAPVDAGTDVLAGP